MSDLIIENAIISYPNLFVAKQINGKGDPKFSATLILPADFDWNRVNGPVQEAIAAKFGANPPANLKMPWQDATPDGFPGQFKVNAYGDRQPQVVDQGVQPVMDQNQIFAGCIVHAYLGLYGYPNNGGGVGVGLNIVQIVNNTTVARLDNSKSAKEVFQPIAGAPPPTAPVQQGYAPAPGAPVAQPITAPPAGAPVAQPVATAGLVAGAPVTGVPATVVPSIPSPTGQPWNQ